MLPGRDKHSKFLHRLVEAARYLVPVRAARVAAFVVYRGKVVSVGANSKRTDPFQARFAKNEHAIFLHAEVAAIKAALKVLTLEELRKSTLYVCRVKFDNEDRRPILGLSKPCVGCRRAIIEFQIPRVVYTVDEGFEVVDVESWRREDSPQIPLLRSR